MGERKYPYNGIVNVYKGVDFTSNDVVAKLRGIFQMKRIGHAGTLDPSAVGVLPVCLGSATKLSSIVSEGIKSYRCRCRLGVATDTEDMTGQIIEERDASHILEEDVRAAALSFVGEYDQIPPMYSAKKVDGERLYKLARRGVELKRKPCRVRIDEITILDISLPEFEFDVSCSKGTYIRSLCRDIGEALGCLGAMSSLVRTSVGRFNIDSTISIDEIQSLKDGGELERAVMPISEFFDALPVLEVGWDIRKRIVNGNPFEIDAKEGRYKVVLPDGTLAAIYDVKGRRAHLAFHI